MLNLRRFCITNDKNAVFMFPFSHKYRGTIYIISMNMKVKVAIVGTRTPKVNYSEWEKLLLAKISPDEISLVVSGGAQGIDTYAKLFAGRHHIPLMEFLPDYAKYGKQAPLRRNTQIVKEATTVIAFPSAESRGTHHSIAEAQRLKKNVIVVRI